MSMFVRANSYSWNKADQSKYKDSIVFIEDSKQIYSNGVYYGGKNNIRLEKIEFSEENLILEPDKFYTSNNVLKTLDITLTGDTTRANTYFVEFMCDNTCVILPSNIKWKNNIVPDFTKTAIMTIKIQDDTAYLIDCKIFYNGLTFTAEEDNSSIGLAKLSTRQTLEYSADATYWSTFNTSTNIFLNKGDKVYVRGKLSAYNTSSNYTQFKMTGKIAASGNLNYIWDYENLDAPLKDYCGFYMFRDCVSLTTAPKLPATTLAQMCYYGMFNGCKSLTTAPELPATTLADGCYLLIFYSCTSLTSAPELPATTLAEHCYSSMFKGCSSLTSAPELPATILADYCYSSMFYGCSSLTTAPELPATTLAVDCYGNMFYNCTSLAIAPELPATTLAEHCYSSMFYGCSSLTTAPELPATELAENCYAYMFEGCTSLTIAPGLSATVLAGSCYFSMFWGCTSLNYIKCLATNRSATNCTSNWVKNVLPTGTFVKHPDMNNWTTGSSGIPSGWTVEDAEIEYQLIDLGLPSGIRWADRNVGALNPEDAGLYFQWGDTIGYTADQVGKDKVFDWDNYKFGTSSNLTKYNSTDGLKVLEPIDDAATVNMGSQYRMPTRTEMQELIKNTTQTFIDVDGNEYIKGTDTINIEPQKLKGVCFTGSNGNSIFMPAASYCSEDSLNIPGVIGTLWSSSLDDGSGYVARYLYFNYDGDVDEGSSNRCYGLSVRGVEFIP